MTTTNHLTVVTQDEWDEAVDKHDLWKKERRGGQRLEMHRCDLRNLIIPRGSILQDTIFDGCDMRVWHFDFWDLTHAFFRNCDLRRTRLTYNQLLHAEFLDCDFRESRLSNNKLADTAFEGGLGIHYLTLTEHGYDVFAIWHQDRWRIQAGCRDYTVKQARRHWGARHYTYPTTGSRIVACLDWLERQSTSGLYDDA